VRFFDFPIFDRLTVAYLYGICDIEQIRIAVSVFIRQRDTVRARFYLTPISRAPLPIFQQGAGLWPLRPDSYLF
jgi:hypothetical protein